MNMMVKKIGICILLTTAAVEVLAWDRAQDERQSERYSQPPQYESQRDPHNGGRDSGRDVGRDNSRYQEGQNNRGNEQQNNPRGRLSPDERRALRQQINDAGRDLYPSRRE